MSSGAFDDEAETSVIISEPCDLRDEAIVSFWSRARALICLGAFITSNLIITNGYCATLLEPIREFGIFAAYEQNRLNPHFILDDKYRISDHSNHFFITVSTFT